MSSQEVSRTYTTIIANTKKVDLTSVSEDARRCNICFEEFADQTLDPNQKAFQTLPYDESLKDDPVMLRCGHIFGELCLTLWTTEKKMTCPMCRAMVLEEDIAADLESIIRQFHLLPSTPVRTLLKQEWNDGSTIILKDEINSLAKLLARLAKFIFILTIRLTIGSTPAKLGIPSPNPTKEFRYPTSRFPLDYNDGANFQNWCQTYLDAFLKANKLKKDTLGGFYLDIVSLLSNDRLAEFYAFVCAMLKRYAVRPSSQGHVPLVYHGILHEVLQSTMIIRDNMQFHGDDLYKPSKIVGMAARAALEYERRLSELTRRRAEITGIQGFRDLEEGDDVFWENGRFRVAGETEACWHPSSKVSIELE